MANLRKALSGGRADLLFGALLSSVLFAYVGFILAVILADVSWLAGPTGDPDGPTGIQRLLRSPDALWEVKSAFRLSLITSFITSLIAMLVAIPSAYVLSRYRIPLHSVIDTVIDLPIVVPPLLAGISLLIFFNQTFVGSKLQEVVQVVYTQRGIVVAQFFVASAFCIRAAKAAVDQVNPRFEAVARSLGCGPVRAFWKVTLPLAKTGLIAGWIMTWARAMGEFAPIIVFAGATPFDRELPSSVPTEVLPIGAYLNLSAGNIEISVAITVLMIGIASVTLLVFKKLGGKGYIW